MKTTRKFRVMLSLITVGLLAGSVGAQDSDGYAESFESYDVGSAITNVAGWEATDEMTVIASTNYTGDYMGVDFPIDYDHGVSTNVLKIENGVTNTIAAGDSSQTNWVDVVIKPVLYGEGETPDLPPAGSVAACYFNANSNLVVFHSPAYETFEWLEIPDVSVVVGQWIRLTVAVNLVNGDEFEDWSRFYEIYINGTVVTNAAAYLTPSVSSGSGGSWFSSGAPVIRTDPITNIVVKGTGYMDDLVVTNSTPLTPDEPAVPSYIETLPTVSVLTDGQTLGDAILTGGSATNAAGDPVTGSFAFVDPAAVPPVGTNSYDVSFTPDDPSSYLTATGSVDVVVVAAPAPTYVATLPTVDELTEGETLADANLTGGTATNAAGDLIDGSYEFVDAVTNVPPVGTNSYDVVFTPTDEVSYLPVTGAVDVVVVAGVPPVTTNGIPTTYYGQFGLTPDGEGLATWEELDEYDSDGDGVPNMDEYTAGTDPTDPASVFRILGATVTGGTVDLDWYGGTNGPTTPYIVEGATSLVGTTIGWMNMTNVNPRAETNTWSGTPGNSMLFFRVLATP